MPPLFARRAGSAQRRAAGRREESGEWETLRSQGTDLFVDSDHTELKIEMQRKEEHMTTRNYVPRQKQMVRRNVYYGYVPAQCPARLGRCQ